MVICGKSGSHVAHKNYDVGAFNGDFSLHSHFCHYEVLGLGFDTAGIDYREGSASPFGFAVYTVPRYAGNILNYCAAFAYKFIEKRTFTDIRSSYDRYYRF